MRVLAVIALSMFLVLTARLWYLQALKSDEAKNVATTNITRVINIEAPRGQIYDSSGKLLVGNRVVTSVTLNPKEIEESEMDPQERFEMLTEVAIEINRSGKLIKVSDIEALLKDASYGPYDDIPIAIDVPEDLLVYFGERPNLYPGIKVADRSVRSYLYGSLASHVIGWVGPVTNSELSIRKPTEGKDYSLRDQIGKSGIELMFEDDLRGQNGKRVVEVDRRGRVIRERIDLFKPPIAGNEVHLTIDIDLQSLLENELERTIYLAREKIPETLEDGKEPPPFVAPGGSSLIISPKTGKVKAMASFPTYDPNESIGGYSVLRWNELNDPANDLPMFNRAIQGEYAPGSTFKVFTAHAAWHNDVFGTGRVKEADQPLDDPGEYFLQSCRADAADLETAGGCVFRNAGSKPYENVDLIRSLTVSSDVYYYTIGESIYINPKHPENAIQETASSYGLGMQTGIQLPFEQDGYIPTPQKRKKRHEENPKIFPNGKWYPGDNVNISVGQGDVLVTPLQLANAYATFANGGINFAPNIVSSVFDRNGEMLKEFGKRIKEEIEIDPEFRNRVLKGLVGVTADIEGTAYWAFNSVATGGTFFPLENFPTAGKTGTAEVRGKADSSLFAAITPAQDPEYVMVTILEEAGFGSAVAAPMSARILEKVVENTVPEALTIENRYAVSASLPLCIDWYLWRESESLKNLESFSEFESEIFGPSLSPDGTVRVRGIEINCTQVIESLLSPIDQLNISSSAG
jgi:penicillin-binding protein 2